MSDTATTPGVDEQGFYDPAQDPSAGTEQPDAGISTEAPEVTDGTDAAGGDTEGQVTEDPQVEAAEKAERRPRGWLAQDVKLVCDKIITGEITLAEGQEATPHRVARLVKEMDGLDKAPSTGAVAAVFKRWEEYGFASFKQGPYAFADYTDEGRNVGLQGMIEARSAARKAERQAAKAAEAPAPAPADQPQDGNQPE